jgi:hypothetical protein
MKKIWIWKVHLNIELILIILFIYFILYYIFIIKSENNSIINNITKNSIIVEKSTKNNVKDFFEDFKLIFTWSVIDKKWIEQDFDLSNIELSGWTLEIEFYLDSFNKVNSKIKYWYMLWKIRNRWHIFYIWDKNKLININKYKLAELEEDWKIEFKAVNLSGWNLYVKIIIIWKKRKTK